MERIHLEKYNKIVKDYGLNRASRIERVYQKKFSEKLNSPGNPNLKENDRLLENITLLVLITLLRL